MSSGHIVETGFWAAFVLSILIIAYSLSLAKRLGGSGRLPKVTYYTGFATLVFGIHHLLEIFLDEVPFGSGIAESVEGIAAVLLFITVYQLHKLVKGE